METKPGWKTTEFWVAGVTQGIMFLNVIGAWDFVPNRVSTYVMGAVAFGYAVARGIAKSGVKPDISGT